MNSITIFRTVRPEISAQNFLLIYHGLLRTKQFQVYVGLIDTLEIKGNRITCLTYHTNEPVNAEQLYQHRSFQETELNDMDYIWIYGTGKRETYFDKMQILWVLSQYTILFNSIESLMLLSNKHWLPAFVNQNHPETYIASNPDSLLNIYNQDRKATWVIKPTASSMGKNIYKISPTDDAQQIILSMPKLTDDNYFILQKYVPEIEKGEKRVIVSGDKIIGYYHRIHPNTNEFRTNMHQGAVASVCNLSEEEEALCKKVGRILLKHGVYFAGLDITYPYIFEANIISPGGLGTLYELTGIDYSDDLIQAIFQYVRSL